MYDRLHELEIVRHVPTLERARLTALLVVPAVALPPAVHDAVGAALARLAADLARLAREEAALRAREQDGA